MQFLLPKRLVAIKSLLVLATISTAAGCDDSNVCTAEYVFLPITVTDSTQKPVAGATVTATNLTSGKVLTGITASDGSTTSIGESIGAGNVLIYADFEDLVTSGEYVEWLCDECHCSPNMASLTLIAVRSVTCTANYVFLPVTVVDDAQMPLVGATVTATNLSNGRLASGTTGPFGTTSAIGEEVGGGNVRVVATLDGRTSLAADVEWTCNECHCLPALDSLTLVIPRQAP